MTPVPWRPQDRRAVGRFDNGATVGLAAGAVGVVLPFALVLAASYAPGALPPLSSGTFQIAAALAIVSLLLFAVSLMFYQSAFASLRDVDPRFWAASALCLLGTVGLLILVAAAAIALSSSDAIAVCVHGAPTTIPSCIDSAAQGSAYAASVGLLLIWLGGSGIVVGLAIAGHRFRRVAFYGAAAAYTLLLIVLAGPLLALVFGMPGLTELIGIAPLLVLVAPALVLDASRRHG